MSPIVRPEGDGSRAPGQHGPLFVIHGGVDMEPVGSTYDALGLAARAGQAGYGEGGLRAATDAVAVLEDHPAFNAGYGSVLTREGTVETDGALADGRTGRFAGIAAAPRIRYPAAVARHLLLTGETVLLVGEAASRFAVECGYELEDLVTEEQVAAAADGDGAGRSIFTGRVPVPSETVGCLVVEPDGAVVAASSTGGLRGQRVGRVGDAAVPGAGYWADDAIAVLCSGAGEVALVSGLARRVAERARDHGVADATEWGVRVAGRSRPGTVAVVAVDGRTSQTAAAHNGASFPVLVRRGDDEYVLTPTFVDPEAGR